jgi:exonuclease SbcD
MNFLHTSDWHVGKTLKGQSRLAEQEAVLNEIVDLAAAHEVDAVLVAGDLYDTAVPGADAQRVMIKTLRALARTGAEVIAMAGNHDNPLALDAYRDLAGDAGITLVGQPRTASGGGVVSFTARSSGERVNVAVLPFLSQKWAVKSLELLTQTPAENAGNYDQMMRECIDHLKGGFTSNAVNLIMAHLTVTGAVHGGGERAAQTIFEYWVPAAVFGSEPHYVALGHLHRRQQLPAPCPVVYSGSPICIDFGEQDNTPVALLIDASPDTPAVINDLPIHAGRRLRTVRGTVEELTASAAEFGDDFLRVYVTEPARAGLREEVLEALPNVLEIRIDPEFAEALAASGRPVARLERSPGELFADYCAVGGVDDPRIQALFDELHDELYDPTLDQHNSAEPRLTDPDPGTVASTYKARAGKAGAR